MEPEGALACSPYMSHMNPVHIPTPYFFKTHFRMIHLHPRLLSGLFP